MLSLIIKQLWLGYQVLKILSLDHCVRANKVHILLCILQGNILLQIKAIFFQSHLSFLARVCVIDAFLVSKIMNSCFSFMNRINVRILRCFLEFTSFCLQRSLWGLIIRFKFNKAFIMYWKIHIVVQLQSHLPRR